VFVVALRFAGPALDIDDLACGRPGHRVCGQAVTLAPSAEPPVPPTPAPTIAPVDPPTL
jgi:hypothetical protein